MAELIDNEFVGDLAKELGLDISGAEINNIANSMKPEEEAKKKKEEEDRKKAEEAKKNDSEKK